MIYHVNRFAIGLYLTVCAVINPFEVLVPIGTQPGSSAP
jgi:hypothetical protein